jgi:hypothetical protein
MMLKRKTIRRKLKKRMFLSFSGGRTSAFMTKWMIDNFSHLYTFIVIFANTGQEHEATLQFIHQCDLIFGFNTIWVEAEVHHNQKKGSGARVVTYETASRNGDPFEQVIKKYGIPNMVFPHCTRELKLNVMTNYLRSIGWKKKTYEVSIGIRIDEKRRVSKKATKEKIVYPLVDLIPMTKEEIIDWWSEQSFDLQIPEHLGNCTWCWKKSLNKHMHVINDMPQAMHFPKRMEMTYPLVGPDHPTSPRRFFRQWLAVYDLLEIHKNLKGEMPKIYKDSGSCSESCELYETVEVEDDQ